ncbi:MAG TPA: flagellar basal body protein [Caulobacteraceae bacterium]|jgi:flagellar basal-body rod protein FlgB|nr:flagellar basal body protein [Caulobacteraceae bacterium]
MTLEDIPLFSALKGRLGYLSERQRVISENVANSDTPGYRPQDLKPFTIKAQDAPQATGSIALASPAAGRMISGAGTTQTSSGTGYAPQVTPDSETQLNGNQVVLEEEMMKLTDARMSYDAAIGFYQKSLSMLQLAIRTPGKGS